MATLFITLPLPGTRTAGKIRLTNTTAELANLPKRFPELHFENGIILGGKSGTETDSLTSEEIAEAYFLLYGLSSSIWFSNPANRISLLKESAAQARKGAEKCLRDIEKFLYVIKRRVIRDLIIRAFAEDDVSLRHKNYREILESDKEQKETIKDFALLKDMDFSALNPLDDFLLTEKFENGFPIMKLLCAADRLVWMEFLASLWKAFHKNFVSVRFADTGLCITAVQDAIAKIKGSGATGIDLKDMPGSAASDREKTVYNLSFRVKDQTCCIDCPEPS